MKATKKIDVHKMTKKEDQERKDRSIKQGAVGALVGACFGVPLVGAAIGVANANKDKLKKAGKKVDDYFSKDRF